MLEGYVIAELAKIAEDAYIEMNGSHLDAETKKNINKHCRIMLPHLDNYFRHRLKVEDLELKLCEVAKRYEKIEQDKGSNDKDYLELSQKHNYVLEQNKQLKILLKTLI